MPLGRKLARAHELWNRFHSCNDGTIASSPVPTQMIKEGGAVEI
jgi:hypothetical protein